MLAAAFVTSTLGERSLSEGWGGTHAHARGRSLARSGWPEAHVERQSELNRRYRIRISGPEVAMKGRIELGDVTPHNIKQLKRLNQVIFPVSYNDKFYKDVLEVGELAKLAYFNDIAVGAVCCRVDHSQNQKRLYIMTLGCLAPYRRLGIGTKMLNHVLNICEKDGTFDNIYLHVQISNESAIDFYRKFGFEIIETKKNYYKRIEPADAHVLQKNLKVPCLGQNTDVQKTDN
ncbi:N-alpha-acetyltransferase 50 isoform X2 [Hemicordylus capensis]|nr:N-alpha-acetyltransferase 50 isoform X2 [Hemicordylus capensis]